MLLDTRLFVKMLSPRIVSRALITLDKATAVVVALCWFAAFIILFFAVYTIHSAVEAKKLAADANIAEPILPVANATPLNPREAQLLVDRLQHQFPEIKVEFDGQKVVTLRTTDGSKFHEWITALSYIDAMEPQFRWTLTEFCVGHCGQELMKATVAGQKVMFTLPQRN